MEYFGVAIRIHECPCEALFLDSLGNALPQHMSYILEKELQKIFKIRVRLICTNT